MTSPTQTVRGGEAAHLKPFTPYGKMVSAVRIPRDRLSLARGLQRRGHTLREIALVLDMSIEPVRRSLYDDVVAK